MVINTLNDQIMSAGKGLQIGVKRLMVQNLLIMFGEIDFPDTGEGFWKMLFKFTEELYHQFSTRGPLFQNSDLATFRKTSDKISDRSVKVRRIIHRTALFILIVSPPRPLP